MSFYSQQLNYSPVCVAPNRSYGHVRNIIMGFLEIRKTSKSVDGKRVARTQRSQIENAIKPIEVMYFITSFLTHMQKRNLKLINTRATCGRQH